MSSPMVQGPLGNHHTGGALQNQSGMVSRSTFTLNPVEIPLSTAVLNKIQRLATPPFLSNPETAETPSQTLPPEALQLDDENLPVHHT